MGLGEVTKCSQNPLVNLHLQEEAQEKQKKEQLEHLWKDMGSVCVQGSTLAGTSAGRWGSLQEFSEEFAFRRDSLFPQQKCESISMLEEWDWAPSAPPVPVTGVEEMKKCCWVMKQQTH